MYRTWMKSKDSGSHVQSSWASSILKRKFGGTQSGWVGEMSIPITSAEGYSSAKSLPTC